MKVFLGGTCNNSKWRDELIEHLKVEFFNPIVDNWTPEAQANEEKAKSIAKYHLYVLTPEMTGCYSIAELIEDSNKIGQRTLFCILKEYSNRKFEDNQWKSLMAVADLAIKNGAKQFFNLLDIASYLNKN